MEPRLSSERIQTAIDTCVREGFLSEAELPDRPLTEEVLTRIFLDQVQNEDVAAFDSLVKNPALMQILSRVLASKKYGALNPPLGIKVYESLIGKSAEATHHLAIHYLHGDHVEKDPQRAIELFKIAAEGDRTILKSCYSPACRTLANQYVKGENVDRDIVSAAHYLVKGSRAGSDQCYEDLIRLVNEEKVEACIQEAISLTFELAQKGRETAIEQLAQWYRSGSYVEQSNDKAAFVLKWGADCGHKECLRHLIHFYLTGDWGQDKKEQGFALCLQEAEEEQPWAMALVAECYRTGNGVDEDSGQAAAWAAKWKEASDVSCVLM